MRLATVRTDASVTSAARLEADTAILLPAAAFAQAPDLKSQVHDRVTQEIKAQSLVGISITIGESDRVILASPCSGHGFKHSAAIGEAIAQLALDGRSRFDLSAFTMRRLLN